MPDTPSGALAGGGEPDVFRERIKDAWGELEKLFIHASLPRATITRKWMQRAGHLWKAIDDALAASRLASVPESRDTERLDWLEDAEVEDVDEIVNLWHMGTTFRAAIDAAARRDRTEGPTLLQRVAEKAAKVPVMPLEEALRVVDISGLFDDGPDGDDTSR